MATIHTEHIKVADEVWVAAALLHREHPEREGFTPDEIVKRVQMEGIHGRLRPGVHQHAVQHSVANRPPNPGRYRMLYAERQNPTPLSTGRRLPPGPSRFQDGSGPRGLAGRVPLST